MGDSIFDDEEEAELEGGVVTLTKEQWETLAKERTELKSSVQQLNKQLETLNTVTRAEPKPATNTSVDPTAMTADEALTLFAKDPGAYTTKVADGRISKAIAEQLAPLLTPIISTTHQGIVQSQRSAFDSRFGVGKFDEIVMPDLQRDLDSLTAQNSNAMGDTHTIKALIERIEGTKRVELNEAEAGVSTARAKADAETTARIVATLPASVQPKPQGGVKELSSDALEMFDAIEQATGERPNHDSFLATQNAKPGIGGFVTAMSELNKGNGKDNSSGGAR